MVAPFPRDDRLDDGGVGKGGVRARTKGGHFMPRLFYIARIRSSRSIAPPKRDGETRGDAKQKSLSLNAARRIR